MTPESINATLDHVIDAYEVGDVDPSGTVGRLKVLRAWVDRLFGDRGPIRALEVIADGEGDPQMIAQQTLAAFVLGD